MSADKQLEDMKKLAIMTGSLTDIHLVNLRNWIYVIFSEPTHRIDELEYNINGDAGHRNSGNYIRYTLTTDRRKKQMSEDEVDAAMNTLCRWIGTLLWVDMPVEVIINNKAYTRKSK